jgi:hypothetical protein
MNNDPIKLQSDEFDAVRDLAKEYKVITQTAVVDDDYPEVRFRYEVALQRLLTACKANRRTM